MKHGDKKDKWYNDEYIQYKIAEGCGGIILILIFVIVLFSILLYKHYRV